MWGGVEKKERRRGRGKKGGREIKTSSLNFRTTLLNFKLYLPLVSQKQTFISLTNKINTAKGGFL